jgi:hypothetical protein
MDDMSDRMIMVFVGRFHQAFHVELQLLSVLQVLDRVCIYFEVFIEFSSSPQFYKWHISRGKRSVFVMKVFPFCYRQRHHYSELQLQNGVLLFKQSSSGSI